MIRPNHDIFHVLVNTRKALTKIGHSKRLRLRVKKIY